MQEDDVKVEEENSPGFKEPNSGGGASGRNKRNSKNLSNDIDEAENENSILSGFQMMAKAENRVYDPSNP